MKKGFIEIPIIILVAISIGVGLWYYKFKPSDTVDTITEEEISTPTPTIEESPTPTLSPTTKPLPTKTPTPKPTATILGEDCSKYVPEDGLSYITVNLKEKNGKPLFGDWIVTIKHTGNCPGIVPEGWQETVIRQGTYTWTSVGIQPQKVRIDVEYHYTGVGFDVEATSGKHVREIEVEN